MSLLTPILWIEIMLPFIILAIVNFDKPNLNDLIYFLLFFLWIAVYMAWQKVIFTSNLHTNISLGKEEF